MSYPRLSFSPEKEYVYLSTAGGESLFTESTNFSIIIIICTQVEQIYTHSLFSASNVLQKMKAYIDWW